MHRTSALPSLTVLGLLAALPAGAVPLTWDHLAANNTWDTTATDIWGGSGPWSNANPDDATFGGTGETVTLGEAIVVGDMTFSAAGYDIAGGGFSLTLASPSTMTATSDAAISAVMTGGGGLTKEGGGVLTLSAVNTYTGDTVINNGTVNIIGGNYTQKISPSSAITVNSGATLKYSAGINSLRRNAVDAMITLNGGTLDYAAPTHGHMGNITLMNGGLWTATSGGGYNGENMQLNGNVTVSGTSASTIGPFNQGIGLNGNREFNVADVTADAGTDLTVSAELENNDGGAADGIIKTGDGTMRLASGSSYSGATQVNGGVLLVDSTLRNTSSLTVGANGTLRLSAINIFVGNHGSALADSRVITVNGGTLLMDNSFDARFGNVVLNDGATWTSDRGLASYDALMGETSAGAATLTVGGSGASTMNGSGGIHLGSVTTFNVADTTGDAGGDLFVNMTLDKGGQQGGNGGVLKTGDGTMVLQKATTYTGGTTVDGGILRIDGGGGAGGAIRGSLTINDGGRVELNTGDALGYGSGTDSISVININDGGVLHRIGGANETLGSVAITMDGGTISASSAGQHYDLFGGGTTVTVNNATAEVGRESVISAQIDLRQTNSLFTVNADAVLRVDKIGDDGGGALTKAGPGTMIIDGDNSYNAATNVTEGTLIINGVHTSTGGYTVSAGAMLGGGGASGASMTVDVGGVIAPGNSIGILTVGALDLDGTLEHEVDGASSDLLVVAGLLDIGGATLDVSDLGGGWTEDAYVIAEYGSLNGTFGTISGVDPAYGIDYDYLGGSQIALVIPEPAAVSLLAFAGLGLCVRRRR